MRNAFRPKSKNATDEAAYSNLPKGLLFAVSFTYSVQNERTKAKFSEKKWSKKILRTLNYNCVNMQRPVSFAPLRFCVCDKSDLNTNTSNWIRSTTHIARTAEKPKRNKNLPKEQNAPFFLLLPLLLVFVSENFCRFVSTSFSISFRSVSIGRCERISFVVRVVRALHHCQLFVYVKWNEKRNEPRSYATDLRFSRHCARRKISFYSFFFLFILFGSSLHSNEIRQNGNSF